MGMMQTHLGILQAIRSISAHQNRTRPNNRCICCGMFNVYNYLFPHLREGCNWIHIHIRVCFGMFCIWFHIHFYPEFERCRTHSEGSKWRSKSTAYVCFTLLFLYIYLINCLPFFNWVWCNIYDSSIDLIGFWCSLFWQDKLEWLLMCINIWRKKREIMQLSSTFFSYCKWTGRFLFAKIINRA